jgi:hypothetical protein
MEIPMRQAVVIGAAVLAMFATPVHAQNGAIGTWEMTVTSPISETKSTLVVREEGGALKAVAKGAQGGERAYDKIEAAGAKITMVITISYEGSPMVITYTGTIEGGKMGGEADFGGMATGTWSAVAAQK